MISLALTCLSSDGYKIMKDSVETTYTLPGWPCHGV